MSWNLNVGDPPGITVQPGNVAVGANGTSASATSGTEPLSYQWRRDGNDLVDGGNITGSTTPLLTILDATILDARIYACHVSSPYGTATSLQATLAISYLAQIVDGIFGISP